MMGNQGGSDHSAVFALLETVADPKKTQERLKELTEASRKAKAAQEEAVVAQAKAMNDSVEAERKLKEATKIATHAARLADEIKIEKKTLDLLKAEFQDWKVEKEAALTMQERSLSDWEKKLKKDYDDYVKERTEDQLVLKAQREQAESQRAHYDAALANLRNAIK